MKARCVHGRITFLSTTGLLGFLLLLWLAGIPPAHAQLSPNPQFQECVETRISQARSEGRTVKEQLRRRIEEICRREASLPQRQQPQEQHSTAVPGQFPAEQVQACIREGIQIARTSGRALTEELRRQIEEICHRDGALPEVPPTPVVQPQRQDRPVVLVAVSDEQLRECIRRVLGFLPTDRPHVTDEQRARIEQGCPEVRGRLAEVLRSGDRGRTQLTGVGTVLDPATTDCIQRTLRRFPSGTGELTEEVRRRVLESCFAEGTAAPQQAAVLGQRQPPAGQTTILAGGMTEQALRQLLEQQLALMREQQRLDQERSAPAISDREILGCIRSVLGSLPFISQELHTRTRADVISACPGAEGRLDQLLSPASVAQSNEECIERVLGRRPASARDLFGDDRRKVEQRCFRNRPVQGRLAAGDEAGNRDRAILDCIRRTLGGLPSSADVMTDSQRVEASRACDAGGRLGQLLSPFAVEQSNQECTRRVLGRLPASARDMTKAEQRQVEQGCFGGRSIIGRLAVEAEGNRRGFFINSQAGEVGSVEKLTNPTALAVLGILLTLFASAISLFKGN